MEISVLVLSTNPSYGYGMVKKIFTDEKYTFTLLDANVNTKSILQFLQNNLDKYCIITTNNIISNILPDTLNEYINLVITNNINRTYNFDVCYISKWLDNCLSYTSQFNLDDRGTTLVRTSGPQGYETVLLTPAAIAKILNTHPVDSSPLSFNEYLLQDINSNLLVSITFTQSPVVYNPLLATSINDYARTIQCQYIPIKNQEQEISNLYFFYFVLVILIVFIFAWMLFKLSPVLNSKLDDYPIFNNPLAV